MFRKKLLPAAIAAAASLCSSPLLAGETCYDFSRLAVGTSYHINDVVDISVGRVHIRNFIKDGAIFVPQNPIDQHLEVTQSRIAQGASSPEIALTFVGMQLDLDGQVKEVSMKVAQQLGLNGRLPAYVEINGEVLDFYGSFNEANGTFGSILTDQVGFFADLVKDPDGPNGQPSYWWRGKIRARAWLGDQIQTITIGAQAAHIDEVCIYD